MKRMNFPGRKMQRQIDAKKRNGESGMAYTDSERAAIDHASQQRSKRSKRS